MRSLGSGARAGTRVKPAARRAALGLPHEPAVAIRRRRRARRRGTVVTAIVAAAAVDPAALRQAFNAAFAGYLVGPMTVDEAAWPGLLARQGVDLGASRVALGVDGGIAAFALVAPRPALGHWRLATMGSVPAARRRGVAARLLDDLIARGWAQQALELEVFAQNEAALRLYRGRGFEPVAELHGWSFVPREARAGPAPPLREVDRAAALAWLDAAMPALPLLPLQVSAPSLAALPAALHAWQRGSAQLVFSLSERAPLQLLSLVDRDPAQRDADALLRALLVRHPARAIRVAQLQRADVGGDALARAGFERQPLHQLLMLRRM
jgi:GNAT superfamily N-acetyltransferase